MTDFLDTFRGTVNTWECDDVGHMNVQFYVARASDAAFYLRHAPVSYPHLTLPTIYSV